MNERQKRRLQSLSHHHPLIFEAVDSSVKKNTKAAIDFIVKKSETFYIERINILGNNVTRESVIRNQLEIDEGDPYNEILAKKSVNNIKK